MNKDNVHHNQQTKNHDNEGFFVTAADGSTKRVFAMAGPFPDQAQALANVELARKIAAQHDDRARNMRWDAQRLMGVGTGRLNRFGLL